MRAQGTRRVLVTGCSGYLGSALCAALLEHPLVGCVHGLDLAPPKGLEHERFRFRKADVRDEFLLRSMLQEYDIDTVYHLAFMTGAPGERVLSKEVNVAGTLAVLEAANKCPAVKKLVFGTCASAYGARSSNPDRLSEEAPLRAQAPLGAVHHRQAQEESARAMPMVRRELKVVTLRICTVVGGAPSAGPARTFRGLAAAASVWFHRGTLQFLDQADLMRVMLKVLESADASGVYNVAPDDATTLAELCAALGKPRLPVPYAALWLGLFLARLAGRPGLSEDAAAYLAHSIALDNAKIKKALGVHFSKGSLAAFLDAQGGN